MLTGTSAEVRVLCDLGIVKLHGSVRELAGSQQDKYLHRNAPRLEHFAHITVVQNSNTI